MKWLKFIFLEYVFIVPTFHFRAGRLWAAVNFHLSLGLFLFFPICKQKLYLEFHIYSKEIKLIYIKKVNMSGWPVSFEEFLTVNIGSFIAFLWGQIKEFNNYYWKIGPVSCFLLITFILINPLNSSFMYKAFVFVHTYFNI